MPGKGWSKRILLSLVILLPVAGLVLLPAFQPREETTGSVLRLAQRAKAGEVERILAQEGENLIRVRYKDGTEDLLRKETGPTVLEYLREAGVPLQMVPEVEVKPAGLWEGWLRSLRQAIPTALGLMAPSLLLLGGIAFFALSGRRPQPTEVLPITKTPLQAKHSSSEVPTSFTDVAGLDEVKQELAEVVEFLRNPERFAALGARVPRGLLLAGPPGTGKTLLARAVAGEAAVPFLHMNGSEFVEVYAGMGAARVRELFAQARRQAPCIVFIDEIDAVGRRRAADFAQGHGEWDHTLNQILVEMDGFDRNSAVVVFAATNRPDILDPALLRPGRFDRRIILERPDRKGRQDILQVHCRDKPLAADIDLEALARKTAGFSGADLENLANEAALLAVRRGASEIGMQEMEEAIERVIAGPRRGGVLSPQERTVAAYHEAGHALVARLLPQGRPLDKVSIVARGAFGGYTRLINEEEQHLWTESQFKDLLASLLAGSVAEQVAFGELSTGSAHDLEQASNIARKMVCRYGMSRKLAPLLYSRGEEAEEGTRLSNELSHAIDEEIGLLVEEARERARRILEGNRDLLASLAQLLLERETLEGKELAELLEASQRQSVALA